MEHEVKDHAVKAYKAFKDPKLSVWHKIKEIGIEVIIIVFAVTLSIWLHDMSDHNKEQKEVKQFLTGLRQDLKNDIAEMQQDRQTFVNSGKIFNYITALTPPQKLSADTAKKYQRFFFNITGLVPNDGRYEGFKSSGKLGNIEDKDLQNDITDLYQEIIPLLLKGTDDYSQRKRLLFQYLYKNMKTDAKGNTNLLELVSLDEPKNISASLSYVNEITGRYTAAIEKSKKIISKIDELYPDNK